MPSLLLLCLGDVGRSPRMQYHALAAVDDETKKKSGEEWEVHILGHGGSACFPQVERHPRIHLHLLPPPHSLTTVKSRTLRLILAPIKALSQTFTLLRCLLRPGTSFQLPNGPDVLMMQNPPAVPTLALGMLMRMIYGSMIVVDWHNFAYTLMGLHFGGEGSPLVQVAKEYERIVGGMADAALCVTHAMKKWLKKEWDIDAHALHDRAQSHFRRQSPSEVHSLFLRLQEEGLIPDLERDESWKQAEDERWTGEHADEWWNEDECTLRQRAESCPPYDRTPFTFNDGKTDTIQLRPDRPALVISSTSWTADEDFTILARAIIRYEQEIARSRQEEEEEEWSSNHGEEEEEDMSAVQHTHTPPSSTGVRTRRSARQQPQTSPQHSSHSPPHASHRSKRQRPLPRVIYIITGTGPMRDAFVASLSSVKLRYSRVYTVFVASADYPLLLGCGDLGISLHTSSSGLDLPMKVVDMFGAGLPVCAVNFACISELVKDGVNGRVFGSGINSTTPAPASTSAAPSHSSASPPASSSATSSPSSTPPSSPPPDSAIELSTQLCDLLSSFPCDLSTSSAPLARLHRGAVAWSQVRWEALWRESCLPLLCKRQRELAIEGRKRAWWQLLSIMLIVVGFILMLS